MHPLALFSLIGMLIVGVFIWWGCCLHENFFVGAFAMGVISFPMLLVGTVNSNIIKEHVDLEPSEVVKMENGTVVATHEDLTVDSTKALLYVTPDSNIVIRVTTGFNAFHGIPIKSYSLIVKGEKEK